MSWIIDALLLFEYGVSELICQSYDTDQNILRDSCFIAFCCCFLGVVVVYVVNGSTFSSSKYDHDTFGNHNELPNKWKAINMHVGS